MCVLGDGISVLQVWRLPSVFVGSGDCLQSVVGSGNCLQSFVGSGDCNQQGYKNWKLVVWTGNPFCRLQSVISISCADAAAD